MRQVCTAEVLGEPPMPLYDLVRVVKTGSKANHNSGQGLVQGFKALGFWKLEGFNVLGSWYRGLGF